MTPREKLDLIEQNIKSVAAAYTFQPNTQDTWIALTDELENSLLGAWEDGILVGASAAEAFSVAIGLGTTMTAQDILNGYLNISVQVAVTQPAVFTAITYQQQMQA